MIELLFEEYNVSENELKTRIYETLNETYRLQPNDNLCETLELLRQKPSSIEIVNLLLNPDSEKLDAELKSERINELDLLRLTAFYTDLKLDDIKLENLLTKQISRNHFNLFYGNLFVFIVAILEEKQQAEIDFDKDLVYEQISTYPKNLFEVFDTLRASIFAKSLSERFASDQANNFFVEQINHFSNSVNKYITENVLNEASLSAFDIIAEAISKILVDLNESLSLDEKITTEYTKDLIQSVQKFRQKMARERLGLKGRGGSKKREGFKWVDDKNKIEFYKTVENLPKIKNKPMWEYAFFQLNENDFHYDYINHLRTQTVFREVPETIFRKAINTWRKYLDSSSNPRQEEKPKAFAFEYTLHLLEFPETKYSSLNKYYSQGKRLSEINSLAKENSK